MFPNVLKPRITHGKDPVVHLPPETLEFRHIQTEIFYQGSVSQGYKLCNDQNAEDKNCSDQYTFDTNYIDHGTYYDIDFSGIILTCWSYDSVGFSIILHCIVWKWISV